MDVTRHNFRAAFALVKKFLPSASFASFDLEFTGLGDFRPSQLDTPQMRYREARADVEEFVPIQFGLTLFRRVEKGYEVMPFNFNLAPAAVYYPPSQRYPMIDRKFTLQGSSVAFLLHHGFDFDKCFRQGVSWLSKQLEEEVTKHVEADLRHRHTEAFKGKISEHEMGRVKELAERISEFVKDADAHPEDAGKQIAILPMPPSPAARALVFRNLRSDFSRIVGQLTRTMEGVRLRLVLYKSAEAAAAHREEALLNDVNDIVTRAVGFRYVIDALVESHVPMVVHNGLIDITKLYGTFVGPLPERLFDFKQTFREAFPVFYDTRLLAEYLVSKDLVVQEALKGRRLELGAVVPILRDVLKSRGLVVEFHTFIPTDRVSDTGRLSQAHVKSNEGFCIIDAEQWDQQKDRYGFGRYMDGEFGHEAGFDAMQTGFLFGLFNALIDGAGTGSKSLSDVEAKIVLTSCGGYRWVDFATATEDEVNRWFGKNVIIISQQATSSKRKLEYKRTLERLLKGTDFEITKTDVVPAGPDVFIAVLGVDGSQLTKDEFTKLEKNAEDSGVNIRRYRSESVPIHINKKRKFSNQT